MTNSLFLSGLLILILLINGAQAVTVLNSIYSTSLVPGEQDSFSMTVKSDTLAEKGQPLTVTTAGNCSSWVKMDTSTFLLSSAGTPVKASISVPSAAYNGDYRCTVRYTGQSSGMFQSRIEVPLKLTVTGGKDAPISAPTLVSTTVPTPTPEITMRAPIPEQVIPAIVPGVASVKPVSGPAPQFPIYGVMIAVLIAVFGIVLVYDYRRGRG